MKKYLLFFIAMTLVATAFAENSARAMELFVPPGIEGIVDRTMWICIDDMDTRKWIGDGHGIIWDNYYVLSAGHLAISDSYSYLDESRNLRFVGYYKDSNSASLRMVELKPEAVFFKGRENKGPDNDLLLLKAKENIGYLPIAPPKLAETVILMEPATIVFGMVKFKKLQFPLAMETRITGLSHNGKTVFLWDDVPQGLSGSGVWNGKGELVGIISCFHFSLFEYEGAEYAQTYFTDIVSSAVVRGFIAESM